MPPERNRNRVIRLYRLEEMLITENGMSVIEICQRLLVNRRTIYRDIELMQELGIPLYKDQGCYKILGTYKVPSYRSRLVENEPLPESTR